MTRKYPQSLMLRLGGKLRYPRQTALTGNVTRLLECPGLDSLWEVDVLDSLTKPLDRKYHGLKIPIRGDKDSCVIPVLMSLGEHVHGKLNINALLLEDTAVVDPAFLEKAQAKDHPLHCLDAGVIASLCCDLHRPQGVRRGHVVVENASDPPFAGQSPGKAGDVNVSGPAAASEPVVKVTAIYKDGYTVSRALCGDVCQYFSNL